MSSSGQKRKSGDDTITLKVKGQGMKMVNMAIMPDCQMRKLMSLYCERLQQDVDTLQFLYSDDCLRIQKRDTPRKLGLSNGDEIFAVNHQHGGGFQ